MNYCKTDGEVSQKPTVFQSPEFAKAGDRLCLTEAQVPSFNGEKADLKPAITSYISSSSWN